MVDENGTESIRNSKVIKPVHVIKALAMKDMTTNRKRLWSDEGRRRRTTTRRLTTETS